MQHASSKQLFCRCQICCVMLKTVALWSTNCHLAQYCAVESCRLLTMERLHGVALTDLAAIRSISSADPEETLITALNTWFGSVLGCETFHADVHAGQLAAKLSQASVPVTCCYHYACMLSSHDHASVHAGHSAPKRRMHLSNS